MNRRTLKKHCKRAMTALIAKHDYKISDFSFANGRETVDAPEGMERRYVRFGFITPGPLKGTPVLWERCSYEYHEYECYLPSERLREIELFETFDFSELEAVERNETLKHEDLNK